MVKRKLLRRSRFLRAGAFFAYLWLARGYKPLTAYFYIDALERPELANHPYAVRRFEEMLADEWTPELPDRRLDIVRDYVFAAGQHVTLKDLVRRYGVASTEAIKRDFKWWCWRHGYKLRDFYVPGEGYRLPADFVVWWVRDMLPQYQRSERWITAEEVRA